MRRTLFTKLPSIQSILQQVEQGKLSASNAEKMISSSMLSSATTKSQNSSNTTETNYISSTKTLESFANLDHGRAHRTGFPEAIFAAGKTPSQIASILDNMALHVNSSIEKETSNQIEFSSKNFDSSSYKAILATRVDRDLYDQVAAIPLENGEITYHETAKIISMDANSLKAVKSLDESSLSMEKKVVVACAGTTDLPVAEEAAVTLEAAGCEVTRIFDVGVAGLHRIINALPKLQDPDVGCIIVCAGMDGALPSVVGGLASVPVIAVPTSVGYGAAFGGVSAMLTMLNSCAPGVGVVNIDNGFGAAALAYKCINE